MKMDLKTIILYLCVCAVCCYPSRPLNDRPNELAWQAWLLVDSQNNNHGETDRRITPKSVFIAPNIGDNGSLPDCAEGYRSDPMGRCIKFVKVDEAAHLAFLLERLSEKFATDTSDELDDEERPTSGPLQVNIPLGGGGFNSGNDGPGEIDPEIAIIVAPTNGNFDEENNDDKVKFDKRNQQEKTEQQNEEKDVLIETTIAATEETTSTMTEPTTTLAPAISDDLQALFFLVPMNKTNHVQNNRTSSDTQQSDTPITSAADSTRTTEVKAATSNTEQTESVAVTTTESADNSTPMDGDMEPEADKVKGKPDLETTFSMEDATDAYRLGLVRFPADRDTSLSTSTVKFPNSNFETSQLYQISTDKNKPLIFPSNTKDNLQVAPNYEQNQNKDPHRLTSSEIEDLFKEYMHQNPEVIALTTDRHVNRRRPVSEATFTGDEIIAQPQIQRPQHYYSPPFNHRNRDRNSEFWRPSNNWRDDSIQKPLVLRFGRHQSPSSASSRLISSERSADNSRFLQLDDQRRDYIDTYGRTRRRGQFR